MVGAELASALVQDPPCKNLTHTPRYGESIQNKPFRVYCVLYYVALKNPIENVRACERSLHNVSFWFTQYLLCVERGGKGFLTS